MPVALQVKAVPEEMRDALAARAASRGQSMQVFLHELLEREARAERNKAVLASLTPHRTAALTAESVVETIRQGRDGVDT